MAEHAEMGRNHEPRRFRESALSSLQRAYFEQRGPLAWSGGEVPHVATNSAMLAHAYAEIAFAFLRDRIRLTGGIAEPLTICELGGGSGRFAFHFLDSLSQLCGEAEIGPGAFRYVLTDTVEANRDFWREHGHFAPWLAAKTLDIAHFDITAPAALTLEISGETITPGALAHPLVVIANYVFDSVPSDLFRFIDGRCFETLIAADLPSDASVATLVTAALRYDDVPVADSPYAEPDLRRLFEAYREAIADTRLLLPAPAIAALRFLSSLSRRGLFGMAVDKGDCTLAALDRRAEPPLVWHGSVSMPVNFHALAHWCEHQGGVTLLPARRGHHFETIGLLMADDAAAHVETRLAWRRCVDDFGPDDFHAATQQARRRFTEMQADELLGYTRLMHCDPVQFGRCLARLTELAPDLATAQRDEIRAIAATAWQRYFPIGEPFDLANGIARLLYAIDDPGGALEYFSHSIELYGTDTGTLYNMACCHMLLGADWEAASLLDEVLRHDPNNAEAAELGAALAPVQT